MTDTGTSDFEQSASVGTKSVKNSEFGDEGDFLASEQFFRAPANLQSPQHMVLPQALPEIQIPMVPDWDFIYSRTNVDKFVSSQLYLAQARGISTEDFYERYVQGYNKYLNELNEANLD